MKKHKALFTFQLYILVTFLIYSFGPIEYVKQNTIEIIFLLFLYNAAFIFGYYLAYSHTSLYNKKFKSLGIGIKHVILAGSLLNIYFSVSYLISYSGSINFIGDIISGITNPGEAYLRNLLIKKESSLVTKFATLFSPLIYCAIPLGVMYFNKLSRMQIFIFIISISLLVSTFLVKGTNFLIVFIAITIAIVSFVSGRIKVKKATKISFRKKALIVMALFYFFYSISSRMQIDTIPHSVFQTKVNQEHILFKVLPVPISIPIMLGTSYVSQGYYGLSLAPSYDFPATFGLGNGGFLMNKLDEPTKNFIWNRTYQAQMEHLWNPRIHWHTAYVWFANDFGLYGVIFIMAIIGYFFSLVLRDAIQNKSALSIILLPLYAIMLIFIPANNIIFNNPMMFMSFIIFNILWVLSKRWRFKY